MFLASVTERQNRMQELYGEVRRIIADAAMPGVREFGISCALKLPRDIHDRVEEVRSRHGLRSLKDTVFKAVVLGLATMEKLPPSIELAPVPRVQAQVSGRVLSEKEIRRIKDDGFDCSREPAPERSYWDDEDAEEEAPAAAVG